MDRGDSFSARMKRRKKIQAAFGAVREEIRLLPREQAREVLIAEFREQGVDPLPSDAALEVMLDSLALTSPLEKALFATRVITETARPVLSAMRDLKQIFGDALTLEGDPINVPVDRDAPTIPVRLEPGALEWLNTRFPPHRRPVNNSILVLLQPAGDEGRSLAVTFNEHRFGVLDGADGEPFRRYMNEGAKAGRPVVVDAIRTVSDDGLWSLELFRPA